MSWRTVVLANRAKVEYSMGYMVIREKEVHRIFMDEIGTILIATPAAAFTGVWVSECLKRKIKIIFCDEKRNPAGEVLPYCGSYDSSRQIRSQIHWEEGTKARIWKSIIKEKIKNQAQVLEEYDHEKEAAMLQAYREDVEDGDSTNREGHAAKVYFNALWGREFSRREPSAVNGALNYGYAIILSACNREAAASGYMTQLGLFHNNIFNPFNLGSDLMEPFRPLVDREVLSMTLESQLTSENKKNLINILNHKVIIQDRLTTVTQAIGIYSRSVFRAMEEKGPASIAFYRLPDEG